MSLRDNCQKFAPSEAEQEHQRGATGAWELLPDLAAALGIVFREGATTVFGEGSCYELIVGEECLGKARSVETEQEYDLCLECWPLNRAAANLADSPQPIVKHFVCAACLRPATLGMRAAFAGEEPFESAA